MFLTIAIPSYNRPETLIQLLTSIDFVADDMNVVICEDNSPKRKEIMEHVADFVKRSPLKINYFENRDNLGYDENLWELIRRSNGEFVIFMGDDDEFVKGSLERFYKFLKQNENLGYVLKSHISYLKDNSIEHFNYYSSTKFFEKGENTIVELFRKSVLISGFCVRREGLLKYYTRELSGTLLAQLYFLTIQCLQYNSAYFDLPLTCQDQRKDTIPYFGTSNNEKELYIPGENSVTGSLNFLQNFDRVLNLIDKTFNIEVSNRIKLDMSKYFYPNLAIQRSRGFRTFTIYTYKICKLGFNKSIYFYIYYLSLVFLGKKTCDKIIVYLKAKLKTTPQL